MTSKIPPHVARELRRHVTPPKRGVGGGSGGGSSTGGGSKGITLLGLCAFTTATASIPYFVFKWFEPLNERDEPLTHAQIRRGAFMNSGSRDIGKDPNWDFTTGTRIKDKHYTELFETDDPNVIDHGDRFVDMARRQRRR